MIEDIFSRILDNYTHVKYYTFLNLTEKVDVFIVIRK